MLAEVLDWFPGRTFSLVADGAYACKEMLADLDERVVFVGRMRGDAAVYDPRVRAVKPGKRGPFDAADIPGANLTFTKSDTPTVPTKGRMLDHIGFEIVGLEAFCKKAEANGVKFDMPFTKRPDLGISLAFMTDPWGTYIELNEGLDKL